MFKTFKRVVLSWNNGVLEIYPDSENIFGNIVILENVSFNADNLDIISIEGTRIFYSYLEENETVFSLSAIERAHKSAIEIVLVDIKTGWPFINRKVKKEYVKKVKERNCAWRTFRAKREEQYSIVGKFPYVVFE